MNRILLNPLKGPGLRRAGLLVALALLILLAVPVLAQVGGYNLAWSRVAGGGAVSSTGGGFALAGSVAPPGAGTSSGGGFSLQPLVGALPLTLHISPDPATVASGGSPVDVRVLLEAGFQQVDTAQLGILFDPALLQVVDADANVAGVQLTPGSAFQQVLTNIVDNAAGTIAFAAGRATTQAPLTGTIDLATIRIAASSGLAQSVTTSLTLDPAGTEVAFAGQALAKVLDDGAVQISTRRLALSAQPIRGAHGFAFGRQPQVVIQDAGGVTLTVDSATVLTLSIKSGTGAGGAVLTCDQTVGGVTTMTVTAGLAAFSGCRIDLTGAGYMLQAAATGVAGAESSAFNVSWAADTNGTCRVTVADYSLVVTHFNKTSASPDWATGSPAPWQADVDGSGAISVTDYSMVITRFGTSTMNCTPPSGP